MNAKINISSCLNGTGKLLDTTTRVACLNLTPTLTSSSGPPIVSQEFAPSSVYFLLVLCSIAVLENMFTCYIIYANKILQTATNTFVFSLCVTDMLCAGVLLPVAVFYKNSLVYLYFAAIIVFTYASNLTAVTYERLVSITKPLRYRSIITKQTALRITIAAWVVPISYCLVPLTWKTNVLGIEHKIYVIIALLVFLVSPLFFICFVYIRILIEVHRLLKESRNLEVYAVEESPTPVSLSERIRRSCCSCINNISQVKREFTKNNLHANRHMHEDSNDELSCTFKTDLCYSAISSQSLSGQKQDGRCSLSTAGRRSCDSGRSCNQSDAMEKGRYLTVEGAMSPQLPSPKCIAHGNSSPSNANGAVNGCKIAGRPQVVQSCPTINDVEINDKRNKELATESFFVKTVPIDVTERECKKGEDCSKADMTEAMESVGESKPVIEKDSYCPRSRVGFLISLPSGEENEGEINNSLEGENGLSEHDSGIEEERFKDAMKICNHDNRRRDDVALMCSNDRNIDVGINHSPTPEPLSDQLGNQRKKAERCSLIRRLKPNGSPEAPAVRPPKRRGRSLRRRHVFEEIKATTAFALVAFTYMFTWIPVIYMTFMEAIDKVHLVPNTIDKVNNWTIAINAAVDPLFYALILRNFRKTIKRQFRRMKNGCN